MQNNQWRDLSSDLNRIIENAVNFGNFGQLNQTINNTIQNAFGTFTGNSTKDPMDFKLSNDIPHKNSQTATKKTYEKKVKTMSKQTPSLFANSFRRKSIPLVFIIIGIFLIFSGFGPLSTFLVTNSITFLISGIIVSGGGLLLALKGRSSFKLNKYFEQHVKSLNGKTYGDIKMLSELCHRSEKNVLKELKKMIDKGWFTQGHIDKDEKCIIVSNETYEQYLNTIQNAKEQAARFESQKEKYSPDVIAIIKAGNDYIVKIRQSNDAIPGEIISQKIDRLESIVRHIFKQVEDHPETAFSLEKMMEYYLPMTIKLLNAYEELDKQPIQSEVILNSKKEIEDTIDTLTVAYGKIFDSLFENTSSDVASDISVLHTVLAQDGLTENDFSNLK